MDAAQVRPALPLLPLLVALADTGQVTEAAALLRLPQPTVSRGLARLSRIVGVPLLERHGRGVRLTAAGQALVPGAREALAAAGRALHEARLRAGVPTGRVTVAFQHTLGQSVVPALVTALLDDFPGAQVELRQGARSVCVDLLAAGEADMAIVAPPVPASATLETVELYHEPLRLAVPARHVLAARARVSLAEAAEAPFIVMKPGYGLRVIVDDLCRQAGVRPRIAFEGEDAVTVRGLVGAGLGVSVLPAGVQPTRGVVDVPLDHPGAVRRMGATWAVPEGDDVAGHFCRLVRTRGAAIAAACG